MTAVIAAFGAIVGYLGAEVAEESMFERILWPQRFYNHLNVAEFVKLSILMPMSGPLHRAALTTLDGFRDHGLYKGFLRGDMLGTAFFAERKGMKYYHRTAVSPKRSDTPDEVRNGFWVEVLSQVERRRPVPKSFTSDDHDEWSPSVKPRRATKPLFRLFLDISPSRSPRRSPGIEVSESHLTVWVFLGILASELSTVCIAVATGLWCRFGDGTTDLPDSWLVGFLCLPLFLKVIAALFSVRRESIFGKGTLVNSSYPGQMPPAASNSSVLHQPSEQATGSKVEALKTLPSQPPGCKEIVEVENPALGFILMVSTPPASSATFQFFRHYGHPIRTSYMDRIRETMSIVVVYAFVLYFPAGLFSLSWMKEPSQYIWLGQQLYCVIAMHIVRLVGWTTCSRTEELVAKLLLQNQTVYLVGGDGCVEARLEIEEVTSVREGKTRVLEILRENEKGES